MRQLLMMLWGPVQRYRRTSVNFLIKLMAIVAVVFAPLFI
jgi:Na+/H+-translocating membrane pyrophosphatase